MSPVTISENHREIKRFFFWKGRPYFDWLDVAQSLGIEDIEGFRQAILHGLVCGQRVGKSGRLVIDPTEFSRLLRNRQEGDL